MHRKKLDIKILLIGPLPKPIHGMSLCNSICLKIDIWTEFNYKGLIYSDVNYLLEKKILYNSII